MENSHGIYKHLFDRKMKLKRNIIKVNNKNIKRLIK